MVSIYRKYLIFGILSIFVGSSNSPVIAEIIGMGCEQKFMQKNLLLTRISYDNNPDSKNSNFRYKTLNGTVSLNNEPEKKCIHRFNKTESGVNAHLTVCGNHIFTDYPKDYDEERFYMSFQKVVDKNGNAFPLKRVSYRTKRTCEDNYRPGVVRELISRKVLYKVRVNETYEGGRFVEPIYLDNRFYEVRTEFESLYRLPLTPNF